MRALVRIPEAGPLIPEMFALRSPKLVAAVLVTLMLPVGAAHAQDLSPQSMIRLAPLPRERFVAVWDSLYAVEAAAARALPDSARSLSQAKVHYRWAMGRVMHPYFHWREGPATSVERDPAIDSIVRALPLESAEWDSLPEFRQYVSAHIHEVARTRMATDPVLQTGDNRWLRAELQAVASAFASPATRLEYAERLIATHIEDNGAEGLDSIIEELRAMAPAPERLAAILKARDDDLARREGHDVHPYATRDGVSLELHVLAPTARSDSPAPGGRKRPAMLWLHGGSLNEGAWWHCPVICTALRANGVTVVGVELRTGNRFESGPLEQLEDATAAMRWVRANASRLGVDPARIGVAGFSSGATIALVLSTRDEEADPSARPDAVIAMGACADPIAPHEDGFFRKRVVAAGLDPKDYSPVAVVERRGAVGLPPLLAVHADADEYCRVDDIRRFVSLMTPGSAELAVVPGATHFFGFYHRPGQQQVRDAIAATLVRWGWAP